MQPQHHHSSSDSDNEPIELEEHQEQTYITDPAQFLNFAKAHKKIKLMDERNPIWSNVALRDISLHRGGPMEDKAFAKVGKLYRNIRRGNTICEIYHQDEGKPSDLLFCRRGMKKFFDLQPEYLKVGAILPSLHKLWRRRIFEGLQEQIQKGGAKIHLYRMFKENGEHCQVSYLKKLDCWLFASKNVTILAKKPQDLQQNYHKQRFYWAKLIGQEFFNILKGMNPDLVEQFKQEINGYTLLGEHCGNEGHQHITKYDKVQIIFYGIVKILGQDHCQPVEYCRKFLNKYGLKMSVCTEKKNLQDKNTIFANIWEMLKAAAQGTMAKEGEGSVLYIVSERDGQQRTVGMCKLKTSQYLIYRKLREMLKFNVSRKGSTANTYDKFRHDIRQFVEKYFKPPKQLEFYQKLGERAFKKAASNLEIDETYLRYKFVEFIAQLQKEQSQPKPRPVKQGIAPKRIIVVCLPRVSTQLERHFKRNKFEIDYMYRATKPITRHTLHILYMIPRLPKQIPADTHIIVPKYTPEEVANCIKQLENQKDISKSQIISFIKSEDKTKSITMLHQKLQAFRKQCNQASIQLLCSVNPTEQTLIDLVMQLFETSEEGAPKKRKEGFKKVFVVPMLIPGSGKSTLAKELAADKTGRWRIVDTDKIRGALMEDKQADLDSAQSQQTFVQSKHETQAIFTKELLDEAEKKELSHDEYIFIDRLCSPANIDQTICKLTQLNREDVRVVVLTQIYAPVRLNDGTYPFSLGYFLTCLKRCLQRENHKTMMTIPHEICKIVLNYYHKMKNFNEKSLFKKFEGLSFVQLEMVELFQEGEYINQHIKKKVEQCLKLYQGTGQPRQSSNFSELVQLLYKYGSVNEGDNLKRYAKLKTELEEKLMKLE